MSAFFRTGVSDGEGAGNRGIAPIHGTEGRSFCAGKSTKEPSLCILSMESRLHALGVRAILVLAGVGVGAGPNQQQDAAYQGNQDDQQPPAGLAHIVEAADRHAQAGQYNGQGKEAHQNAQEADQIGQDPQGQGNDKVAEYGIPILTAAGTAIEVHIV